MPRNVTEGSGYHQGNQKKEPGLPATSHLGQKHSWDSTTYMPCLSTCLSHSEPCENARPQNSHGKRFSGLIAAPWSENLIRSVRRKQKRYLCAVGIGRRDKSTFIRKPALFPSLENPFMKAISRSLILSPIWLFTKGYFKNRSWFPGPKRPHSTSLAQLLLLQIIWVFLA